MHDRGEATVVLRPRRSLSPAQEVLWAGQRLHPAVPLANMATISHFAEPIDPARLVAAFDTVVTASDTLRTTVEDRLGVPVPTVGAQPPLSTEIIDVETSEIDAWAHERVSQPVDLGICGYDSVLVRQPGDRWSWYLCLHHVITDATSSSLVFAATAAAYEGRPFTVGSYREHLEALEGRAVTPSWQRAHRYWLDQTPAQADPVALYGPVGPPTSRSRRLHLPTDTDRVRTLTELLDGPLATFSPDLARLAALATTLAVYVHRVGGMERMRIGVPVHHRPTDDARSLVGLLMELYPITIEVGAGDTFRSIYDRTVRECITMLRRAEPGAGPRQDFDAVLNVVTASFGPFGAVGATTEWLHSGHVDPTHRLRCQVYDFTGAGRLDIALDVSDAIADGDASQRVPDHFAAVLDAFLADPDAGVGTFPLVGAEEQGLVLDQFNRTAPIPSLPPVDVVGSLRARLDEPVIREGSRVLTADELANEIDRVAAWLRDQDVGRGDRVGVRMARGLDAVVVIHGVLRAGAAFCPLDPDLPASRLSDLIDDLDPALVIDRLPDLDGVRLRSIGRGPDIGPDDLAYVMYTSGSTGRPKGVPIHHRGLSQYLEFARQTYIGDSAPVVALHSSLSFDLTITSLFLPLIAGGQLDVFEASGAAGLRDIVDQRRVTFLKATPSHLELLERMLDGDHPLRTLIVGGESFGRNLADRLLAIQPELVIFNEYGPTEGVVGCMIHRYDQQTDRGADVPIGRPAPGVHLVTLDPYGHLTPLGASGELYLSRPGMADSYWRRPELSRDRFVMRPELAPELLYRTGDRVRMIDASTMTYEGRFDEQLKLGGIRIEPGEIEAALAAHPDVGQCVVRVWTPTAAPAVEPARCSRCGLAEGVPGVSIDDGICSVCREFDAVAERAHQYFGTPDDLRVRVERAGARRTGDYDCLHLLSGGKDSTYSLYQLVDMGFRVRALTLDNGFISEAAKANVRRVVQDLGVDHEFVSTDAMNDVFRDSLERYSNVCNGCFKVLYTLAVQQADEYGIPVIVTGLSRGQFFETRLTPAQFSRQGFDPAAIDTTVMEARKAYHREHDAVARLLDVSVFDSDDVFERIEFVDFYRYCDVELDHMLAFLDQRAPWIRPGDTGRSTNCLVNAAGIHVHQLERGFHNYALPYSWDVRLGHKTRAEALEELDDPVVPDEVEAMLATIGYQPRPPEVLTAWYEAGSDLDPGELRARLVRQLPSHAVPTAFVRVESVPLTANGKVDLDALPAPQRTHRVGDDVPAETDTELVVGEVWASILGLETVSVTTPFFDMGGTSLQALEMIVAVSERMGIEVPEKLAFQHRTVRDLSIQIDALLREAADRPDEDDASISRPVVDSDRTAPPLSVGEEAMLFHARTHPGDTRYNVTRLYRVDGPLDCPRLRGAVEAVVALHQPLHTSYRRDRRRLGLDEALAFETTAIGDEPTLHAWAEAEKRQPFELDDGPLVRVGVAHLGEDQWAVLVGVPHIVADAGALDVFWDQVATAYEGSALPTLPVSYAEVGERQRTGHRSDPGSAEYWRSWLGDARAPSALKVARPPVGEPDGYVQKLLAIGRSDLAAGPGRTPFSTSLAAFAVVLDRYGRGDEPAIAVTSSVREGADTDALVGYFLNPLPLRVPVAPDQTFAEVCARADEVVAASLPHRTYPYARMVRDARADGREEPPLDIMLAYEDLAPARLGDLAVDHEILPSGTAVTDVTAFVQVRGEAIELGLEYRGEILDRAAAEGLLEEFAATLGAGLARPDEPVRSLRSDAAVRHGPPMSRWPSVMEAINAQPGDQPAVRCGDDQLTYGGLRDRRDEIARVLRAQGVSAGDRVGLLVSRSTDAVAAMLASWQLGAAYVPLDPGQPSSRLWHLVEACRPVVILTDDDGVLADDWPAPVVLLHRGVGEPVADPETGRPGDVAYVIFTSGSTGTPKGVEVSHDNLAASTAARESFYDRGPDRFLMVSNFSFDSSMVGLFWTLTTGGELVVPPDAAVHDVDQLADLIDEEAVTHTLMVPSLWRAMVDRAPDRLASLETVIVAGESCPVDLVERHHASCSAQLVNEYGPTEATVWATAHRCPPGSSVIPIGAPIAGVTVAVFDEQRRIVPDGVVGELWISGPTVVQGYLDGLDPSSFVTRAGTRWYRTGDRASTVRGAPHLLFHGRLDDQLSVGGRRVEPAEIEHVLTGLGGVHQAAVGVSPATGALVAHVEADAGVSETATRDRLRAVLPAALVPRRVIVVDELPRTSNGKIDRAAIVWDADVGAEPEPEAVDPDELDTMIAAWRHVFADPTIHAQSDFFDLGGDSLVAVSLAASLEEVLDRAVPINLLVEARTPADLSAALSSARPHQPAHSLLVPLRRNGSAPPLVVISPGGGHVLGYEPLVGALDADVPVWGLRLPGSDGREAAADSVDALADRFEDEVAAAFPDGPLRVLGFSTGGLGAYELAQRLRSRGRTIDLVVLIDTVFPGRQRAVSSQKGQRYGALVRRGGVRALAAALRDAVRRRVLPPWAAVRRRVAAALGRALPAQLNEVYLYRASGEAAMTYAPRPYGGPTLVVRASSTDPALTESPWLELVPDADVVVVGGSHFGEEDLMKGERIAQIARAIERVAR